MPSEFDKVFAQLEQLRRQVKGLSKPQLAHSSFDAGPGQSIDEVDPATGNPASSFGTQYDGSHGVVPFVGPTPPEPLPAITEAAPAVLTAGWNGEFVGGVYVVPTLDWSHLEVHASMDPAFTAAYADTIIGTINTPRGGKVTVVVAAGVWYVRLVSRSLAGKRSAASPAVQVTVPQLVDTSQIEADLEAANQAIADAASDAEEAFDLADEASRKVTISPNIPSGTGVPGALWFRKNETTGAFIGQWEWVPGTPTGSWTPRTTDGGIISNMAVTNLVAGSGTMTQAVIDKLYTDVVVSRKMVAGNVFIGTGGNIWPVELSDTLWPTTGGITKAATGGHNNGPSLLIPATATQISSVYGIAAADRLKLPKLEPGVTYRVKVRIRASAIIPIGGATVQIRLYPATGTTFTAPTPAASFSNTTAVAANTWATVEAMFTVPETSANLYVTFGLVKEATAVGNLRFSGLVVQGATTGDLVAENSITAPKIVASEEMSAKIASFLQVNAGMVNTNSLWADAAWIAAARSHILTVLTNADGQGYTSTITGQGLRVTYNDGTTTTDVIRLGTFGADFLGISDGAGRALTTITGAGDMSTQTVYINGDAYANGRRLGDAITDFPRGEVAYGAHWYTSGNVPSSWATSAVAPEGVIEVEFTAERGRAYHLQGTCKAWFTEEPGKMNHHAIYRVGGLPARYDAHDGRITPPETGVQTALMNVLAWQNWDFGGRFIPIPWTSPKLTDKCRVLYYVQRWYGVGRMNIEYAMMRVTDEGYPAAPLYGQANGYGVSGIPATTRITSTHTPTAVHNYQRGAASTSTIWTKNSTVTDRALVGSLSAAAAPWRSMLVFNTLFTELTAASVLDIESVKIQLMPGSFRDAFGAIKLGLTSVNPAPLASFNNASGTGGTIYAPDHATTWMPETIMDLGAWPSDVQRTIELPRSIMNLLRSGTQKYFTLGLTVPNAEITSSRYAMEILAANISCITTYTKKV